MNRNYHCQKRYLPGLNIITKELKILSKLFNILHHSKNYEPSNTLHEFQYCLSNKNRKKLFTLFLLGGTINSRTIAYVEGHTNLLCNTTLKPRSTTIYHNGQNKS
mmetsp:Transcript_23320/g.51765  ORF Transcript_23320/g.51765 Transcript_23320/m.51765 type:complete len:105 (+) Transcript_23320:2-316(+)